MLKKLIAGILTVVMVITLFQSTINKPLLAETKGKNGFSLFAADYTVTYDLNGGTGTTPVESNKEQFEEFPAALITGIVAPRGLRFLVWNTQINGEGSSYDPGNIVIMPDENLTLFAIWEYIYYSVSYNLNNGTGTTPTETNKHVDEMFSVAQITGIIAPTGQRFKEWNTALNGTGTSYAPGAAITMNDASLTLYAIWENVYEITYNLNGGTGTVPTEPSRPTGATFTAAQTTGINAPVGMRFKEWNTKYDGSGNKYVAGDIVTMTSGNITLFAIWENIPLVTYKVTYDLNGGTGTAPTESDKTAGATFVTPQATNITAPSGQRFKEWNTAQNGSGTGYKAGVTVTVSAADITLYAIWEVIPPPTYAVVYNLNGGTGTAPTEPSKTAGATFQAALTTSINAPLGQRFKEWNTAQNGSGTGYAPGATVTMTASDITLYAIWENIPSTQTYVATVNGGTGSGYFAEKATVSITAGTPTAGQQFSHWSSSPAVTFANPNSAATTFIMPASPVTVTANYTSGSSTAKKVTVTDVQNGSPEEDVAGSATYAVTTANIANGKYVATLNNAPVGVSAVNVTISGNTGVLTINTTASAVNGTFPLTLTIDGTTSAVFYLTINKSGASSTILYVSVSPTSLTLQQGWREQFYAYVGVVGNGSTGVTWRVSGNSSSGTYITSDGILTVAANETSTRLTVRATSVADASKYDTASVTIQNPQALTYTVTFNGNGGSVSPSSVSVLGGSALGTLLPNVSRTNYTFKGWNTSPEGTGSAFTSSTVVNRNMTVYAIWSYNASSQTTPAPTVNPNPNPTPTATPSIRPPSSTPAPFQTPAPPTAAPPTVAPQPTRTTYPERIKAPVPTPYTPNHNAPEFPSPRADSVDTPEHTVSDFPRPTAGSATGGNTPSHEVPGFPAPYGGVTVDTPSHDSGDYPDPSGGVLGTVLYSDVTAYINGYVVPVYVIYDKSLLLINAEDLRNYGFNVIWDGTDMTLSVVFDKNKEWTPLNNVNNKALVGTVRDYYVYSEIKTYVAGEITECFVTSGETLIDFENLTAFGNIWWNDLSREIFLTIE